MSEKLRALEIALDSVKGIKSDIDQIEGDLQWIEIIQNDLREENDVWIKFVQQPTQNDILVNDFIVRDGLYYMLGEKIKQVKAMLERKHKALEQLLNFNYEHIIKNIQANQISSEIVANLKAELKKT